MPVAIAFAAANPERVDRLILHGGFHHGRLRRSDSARAEAEAYLTLMRHGWAAEGSQFLQAFASIFIPDGTQEQIRSLTELQRISTDAPMAIRLRRAFDELSVTDLLPRVRAPTLVVHARNDGVHPLSQSIEIAATIPGAALVVLESRDHVLAEHEPAWAEFFGEVARFLRA